MTTIDRPVRRLVSGGRRWAVAAVAVVALVGAGVAVVVVRANAVPTVPEQFRALVHSAAASCPRLDVHVLAAQLEQESGWDASATSRAGAQGIAQFMPSVWRAYAVDGDGDGVKDVWNPADAIPSAAHFDCVLLDEVAGVGGDPARAMLAAYNAGPDVVKRYAGVPPFPETRHYVDRVLARAAVIVIDPVPASG